MEWVQAGGPVCPSALKGRKKDGAHRARGHPDALDASRHRHETKDRRYVSETARQIKRLSHVGRKTARRRVASRAPPARVNAHAPSRFRPGASSEAFIVHEFAV